MVEDLGTRTGMSSNAGLIADGPVETGVDEDAVDEEDVDADNGTGILKCMTRRCKTACNRWYYFL
jgi:hypothetical protein